MVMLGLKWHIEKLDSRRNQPTFLYEYWGAFLRPLRDITLKKLHVYSIEISYVYLKSIRWISIYIRKQGQGQGGWNLFWQLGYIFFSTHCVLLVKLHLETNQASICQQYYCNIFIHANPFVFEKFFILEEVLDLKYHSSSINKIIHLWWYAILDG